MLGAGDLVLATSCGRLAVAARADRARDAGAREVRSGPDGSGEPAALQDAPTLAFGGAAPHTVIDAVGQGVLQAFALHRTGCADLASSVDAYAVAREEQRGRLVAA